jgi:hypothetical protein
MDYSFSELKIDLPAMQPLCFRSDIRSWAFTRGTGLVTRALGPEFIDAENDMLERNGTQSGPSTTSSTQLWGPDDT